MAWRDLLIQVGSGPLESQRLALAADLAERLDARLCGAHVKGPRLSDLAAGASDVAWMASAEVQRVLMEQETAETNAAAAAHKTFKGVVGEDPASGWLDLEWSAEAWVARARRADLTIVGRPNDPTNAAPLGPDRLACASGRPVLILPPTATEPVGQAILVAWNGGREAARALNDAMPLLEQARSVTVISVETAGAPAADDDGLKAHLQAHGVAAALVRRRSADAAAVITQEARARGADLIVMGVYGRTRIAEWVLGGVSRAMLADPSIPILISH